jgi:hypothetical protein
MLTMLTNVDIHIDMYYVNVDRFDDIKDFVGFCVEKSGGLGQVTPHCN